MQFRFYLTEDQWVLLWEHILYMIRVKKNTIAVDELRMSVSKIKWKKLQKKTLKNVEKVFHSESDRFFLKKSLKLKWRGKKRQTNILMYKSLSIILISRRKTHLQIHDNSFRWFCLKSGITNVCTWNDSFSAHLEKPHIIAVDLIHFIAVTSNSNLAEWRLLFQCSLSLTTLRQSWTPSARRF